MLNKVALARDFQFHQLHEFQRLVWNSINRFPVRSSHSYWNCPISINAMASQLVINGRYSIRDHEFARLVAIEIYELRKVPRSDPNNISGSFSDEEIFATHLYLQPGKTAGPDAIFPKLIIHSKNPLKSWLRNFISSCLQQLEIPKNLEKSANSSYS